METRTHKFQKRIHQNPLFDVIYIILYHTHNSETASIHYTDYSVYCVYMYIYSYLTKDIAQLFLT